MDIQDIGVNIGGVVLAASFDGRLKSDEGFLSATGDLCTLTASAGKDLYITGAKITFYGNTNSIISTADVAELKLNDIVKETSPSSIAGQTTSSGTAIHSYEFKNLFHKITPAQIMKLEVTALSASADVEGFIQAIEVPTGEDPTKYRGD